MRSRLLPPVCLLAMALPAATAVAGHDKPVVETRTYQVQMLMSGTYTQTVDTAANPDNGYCPGTGQFTSAQFQVNRAAKLKVKLDTNKAYGADAANFGDQSGNSWKIKLVTNVADNDCSYPNQTLDCEGDVVESKDGPATDFAYAQGKGHRFAFGIDLAGVPSVELKETDCQIQSGNGVAPPPGSAGLGEALGPYTTGVYGLQLTKLNQLKKGHSLKHTYKLNKDLKSPSYDVATCNHSAGCTAGLSDFKHTIVIKRLK